MEDQMFVYNSIDLSVPPAEICYMKMPAEMKEVMKSFEKKTGKIIKAISIEKDHINGEFGMLISFIVN